MRKPKAASKTKLIFSVVCEWKTQWVGLAITAMQEEKLIEKFDILEGHFNCAIACNPYLRGKRGNVISLYLQPCKG